MGDGGGRAARCRLGSVALQVPGDLEIEPVKDRDLHEAQSHRTHHPKYTFPPGELSL